MKKLAILSILLWLMVQPAHVGKGQNTGEPPKEKAIHELIEHGRWLSEKDSLQNTELARLARPRQRRQREATQQKIQHSAPAAERIYFRQNGEVVYDRLYVRDGGFLVVELDTVLLALVPEPDTILLYQSAPAATAAPGKGKFITWIKNIFKTKKHKPR